MTAVVADSKRKKRDHPNRLAACRAAELARKPEFAYVVLEEGSYCRTTKRPRQWISFARAFSGENATLKADRYAATMNAGQGRRF